MPPKFFIFNLNTQPHQQYLDWGKYTLDTVDTVDTVTYICLSFSHFLLGYSGDTVEIQFDTLLESPTESTPEAHDPSIT